MDDDAPPLGSWKGGGVDERKWVSRGAVKEKGQWEGGFEGKRSNTKGSITVIVSTLQLAIEKLVSLHHIHHITSFLKSNAVGKL